MNGITIHVSQIDICPRRQGNPKTNFKNNTKYKNHYAIIVTNKTETKKQPVVKQKYKCQNKFTKKYKNEDTESERRPSPSAKYNSQ